MLQAWLVNDDGAQRRLRFGGNRIGRGLHEADLVQPQPPQIAAQPALIIDHFAVQTDLPFGRISNAGMAEDTVTVGSEEYFVIGDNPDSSEDSRYTDIGNVKLSDIEGKAWYVLSPRARRGKL